MIANKHTVQELKDALSLLFDTKNPSHVEESIVENISDSKLLSLARAHEQDALGVEIMHYVNSCVEAVMG